MNTFRFLNFPIYKEAKRYYFTIVYITTKISFYELKNQLQRAVLSVVLNIVEGSAKKSDKKFMNEVVACLDILYDDKKLEERAYKKLLDTAESIVRQLGGFIRSLKIKN